MISYRIRIIIALTLTTLVAIYWALGNSLG